MEGYYNYIDYSGVSEEMVAVLAGNGGNGTGGTTTTTTTTAVPAASSSSSTAAHGGNSSGNSYTSTFPSQLHFVLLEVEKDGQADVVSWKEHGRCFYVHNQDRFAKELLPL